MMDALSMDALSMDAPFLDAISSAWAVYQDYVVSVQRGCEFSHFSMMKSIHILSKNGAASMILPYFLDSLEEVFKEIYIPDFWSKFESLYSIIPKNSSKTEEMHLKNDQLSNLLSHSLTRLCSQKSWMEYHLCLLLHALDHHLSNETIFDNGGDEDKDDDDKDDDNNDVNNDDSNGGVNDGDNDGNDGNDVDKDEDKDEVDVDEERKKNHVFFNHDSSLLASDFPPSQHSEDYFFKLVFSPESRPATWQHVIRELRMNFRTWMLGSAPVQFSELLRSYFNSKLDALDDIIDKEKHMSFSKESNEENETGNGYEGLESNSNGVKEEEDDEEERGIRVEESIAVKERIIEAQEHSEVNMVENMYETEEKEKKEEGKEKEKKKQRKEHLYGNKSKYFKGSLWNEHIRFLWKKMEEKHTTFFSNSEKECDSEKKEEEEEEEEGEKEEKEEKEEKGHNMLIWNDHAEKNGLNFEKFSSQWNEEMMFVMESLYYLELSSMVKETYNEEIMNKLKAKLLDMGEQGYEISVLPLIFQWIEGLSLHFLPHLIPSKSHNAETNTSSISNLKHVSNSFNSTFAFPSSLPSHFSSPPAPTLSSSSSSFSLEPTQTKADILSIWGLQLRYNAYEILCRLRISQLFDIVVDFPESMPAVQDLKICLKHTKLEKHLISSFCEELNRRLLSPGAATSDVLHHYISTIKCLRVIDTNCFGIVLENVIPLVSSYLHTRKDTIRCLVSILTEGPHDDSIENKSENENKNDSTNEQTVSLLEELEASHGDSFTQENENEKENEEETEGGEGEEAFQASEQWMPPPIEADPRQKFFHPKRVDVVRILVTEMFGSNEPFIEEYKSVLAEKLLAKTNYDTNQEIRILELLKIRFGESVLQNCEVMIKDMADSKRTNANIQMEALKASPLLSLPSSSPPNSTPLFSINSNLITPGLLNTNSVTDLDSIANPNTTITTDSQLSPSDTDMPLPERLHFGSEDASSEGDRDRSRSSTEGRFSAGDMEGDRGAGAGGEGEAGDRGGMQGFQDRVSVESSSSTLPLESHGFSDGSRQDKENDINEPPPFSSSSAADERYPSSPLHAFTATIVSALFWPKFQEEKFCLPNIVKEWMKTYSDHYHSIKTPRKLQWKTNLGRVKLELEFDNRAVEFDVSPVQASLICLFHEKPCLLAREISSLSHLPSNTITRKMSFWVSQGILKESIDPVTSEKMYTVIEYCNDSILQNGEGMEESKLRRAGVGGGRKVEEEEEEGREEAFDSSMDDRQNQESSVIESYVMGMLTTFDSLPLDRIHNMLKMFMVDPPYDKNIQQLQIVMARLIAEEKLDFVNNVYKKR